MLRVIESIAVMKPSGKVAGVRPIAYPPHVIWRMDEEHDRTYDAATKHMNTCIA